MIAVLECLDHVAKALGRTYRTYGLADLIELAYEAAVEVLRDHRPEHGDLNAYASVRLGGAIVDHFRREARRHRLRADNLELIETNFAILNDECRAQREAPQETQVAARELVTKTLEGMEQEVVVRRYWGDEDLDEIAESMGRNKSTTSRAMTRALGRMAA